MKKTTVLVFLFIGSIACLLWAADKPKTKIMDNYIAVFDLETKGKVDKDTSYPLSESIRQELVKSGKYKVIDRGNMNKILGEQKFQLSGCVAGECIVEAGQLLGVGKIITGSVSKLGGTYYLSLSLINVQSGQIEEVSEDTCKCEEDELINSSKRLVKKLLGEKVDELKTISTEEQRQREAAAEADRKRQAEEKERQERLGRGERFYLNGGIIEDLKLELQWAPAPDRSMNHYEAEKYARNLSLAGGGWRLPTRAELKSLYDTSKPKHIDPVFNIDIWVWGWTSELEEEKGFFPIRPTRGPSISTTASSPGTSAATPTTTFVCWSCGLVGDVGHLMT
jgi:hypothetical protein